MSPQRSQGEIFLRIWISFFFLFFFKSTFWFLYLFPLKVDRFCLGVKIYRESLPCLQVKDLFKLKK